jgi:hypothetical protein
MRLVQSKCARLYARGLDALWGMYQWLDRAARGRTETRSKGDQNDPIPEIAGPMVENLVEMATLLAARRGNRSESKVLDL